MTISNELAHEVQQTYVDSRKSFLLNSLLFSLLLSYEGWAFFTQSAPFQPTTASWLRLPLVLFILPALGYYGVYRSWRYLRLLRRFVSEYDLADQQVAVVLLSQQMVAIERVSAEPFQVTIFQRSYQGRVLASSTGHYYFPLAAKA